MYLRPKILAKMLAVLLFTSGGEIFVILIFILIFFGADKIPEFTRMMGKGVREFKKATDDIKREFNDNTSGVLNDIRSIQNNLTESLTKEIAEPMQKTADEATKPFEEAQKTFEEYEDQYNKDYYYEEKQYDIKYGNEYRNELTENATENVSETPVPQTNPMPKIRKIKTNTPKAESQDTKPKTRNPKPKTQKTKPAET